MDPAVAGFLGGLVGGLVSLLPFIVNKRSESIDRRETLVAGIRALHAELVGDANALLTGRTEEISTENWNRHQLVLANADHLGPAVFPWDRLGTTYWKLRSIAGGMSTPTPEFPNEVQKLADELLDIADRAFDVHFQLPLPPSPSPDQIREAAPSTAPLTEPSQSERIDRAISSGRLGRHRRVRRAVSESSLLAIGVPAGDRSTPGQGTESDLVHYVVEENGHDYTVLPVFTRTEYLVQALQMNRDWLGASVLELRGDELLENVHADVNLVINPWSAGQFIFPARQQRYRLR